MSAPKQLNGYDVIDYMPARDPGNWIVVVYRPEHRMHPFVVAQWCPELRSAWSGGDYLSTRTEATKAMKRRARA